MKANKRQSAKNQLITVICDNYTTRDDLESSWGFSCLIKHRGKNVLFDTGSDGIVLAANMSKLSIDPVSIDLLMISHQHWDHTGGIYYILNAKHNMPVCLPYSFSARFKEDMKRYGAELIEVKKAQAISPGLYSTGDMEGPVREQAALLQSPAGTIVITGCAHPGIVKIVKTAEKILPDDDLALVMGGFHLLDNENEDILKIIEQFKKMGVRYTAASHCSGQNARKLFAREYQDHFIPLGAGTIINLQQLR
ncbi:MAG: MBL fold metallo-hydrolase [Syntrophaceae bacterium]|nr:MBL fold metallo-hydrolase [Syntrophaceae bacterium]